mgnify:FL=1
MKYITELKSIVEGTILENEPMAFHTSYGIGGPVNAYITPKDRKDLANILKFANKHSIKTYFIGSGSNLLVSDSGINGIVLTPAKSLNNLEIKGKYVDAESGVMLGKLVKECIKRNLSGVESLVGVPGTLGGAIVMNAGAFGKEISNFLESVDIMDTNGSIIKYQRHDIDFSYRFSSIKSSEFVLKALFKLNEESAEIISQKRLKASSGRKTNQPLRYRSAGSVFKNPKENAAGFLIDQAGLKGTKSGNAEISNHHANFFINHGNASCSDITKLIRLTRNTILKKYGIRLELELKTIGIDNSELE